MHNAADRTNWTGAAASPLSTSVGRSFKETSCRAFELAYFIHQRRDEALGITHEAWAALEAHLKPQKKRAYYILRGRKLGEVEVKARTKVSVEDSQKLQSLVYLKSEVIERKQESEFLVALQDSTNLTQEESPLRKQHNTPTLTPRSLTRNVLPLTDDDWLIRFIKHLAAISVARSSFYVTLAVGRAVFNYTTEEAVEIYYAIVPDEDRWKDGQYFRKRRNEVLMKELRERFGERLQTRLVAHGEQRFKCRNDGQKFAALVNQCLEMFTPWNTECIHAERLSPMNKSIDELSFEDKDPEKEHPIEARRMHTLIHPNCFARLTAALRLDSPNQRLEVPIFFFSQSGSGNQSGGSRSGGSSGSNRQPPAPLTGKELAEIDSALGAVSKRRKRAKPEAVVVMVDGVERETIRLDQRPVHFRVDESAKLIEIKSLEAEEALLLGSLLLDYRELSRTEPQRNYQLHLAGGRDFSLTISPIRDADGEFGGADVEVNLRTARSFARLTAMMDTIRENARAAWRRPAFALSMLAILAIGATIVILVSRMHSPRQEYIAQVQPQPSPPSSSVPQISQSDQHAGTPSKSEQSQPAPSNRSASSSGKTKGNKDPEEGTRSLSGEAARELAAVRRVYVAESKSEFDGKVRAAFIDAIAKRDKIHVTSEADADAYLYLDLSRIGSTTRIEARLMSRDGIMLWNSSRAVEKGDDSATVARAMAQDLASKLAQ